MATDDAADKDKELEELRTKVATLESDSGSAKPRTRWGRGFGAIVLLVIAGLVLPTAITAVWANRLISNTDRYVQTVSPLASDPTVQAAITNRITTEVTKYVDVESITSQALTLLGNNGPLDGKLATQLQALTGPIADGVNGFVRDKVAEVVASPQFAKAWDQANATAHPQVVAVLTGKGSDTISTDNGTISINIGAFVTIVKQNLVDRGFSIASAIPDVNAQIVLFQSEELTKAQTAFKTLNTAAWLFPLLFLLLVIGAILLAPSRRLGFAGTGLTIVIATLVSLAALAAGRIIYLRNIPTDVLPGGAAGSVFDTLTRFLKQGLVMGVCLGLVIFIAAMIAGPSRGAVAIRRGWCGGLARFNQWLRSLGLPSQPVAPWVERNAKVLRIVVVVLGVATLVIWSYPTPKVAFWLGIAVLFGLAVIDFLRAPVLEGDAPQAPSADADADAVTA